MSNRLAAWIGWPGSGPAPGHDWLPGPKLRFTILGLTYAFLALALTVNYAYSTAFFLLALIGLYVGFHRGFVNGLTRTEKLVMLAFAAYVGVAMASYLLGTQTNTGFRFLGRDLRFLLFIPVYLAIRWARPKARHIGWALTLGAVASAVFAGMDVARYGLDYRVQGMTGVAITFGDLSLLSGFLGACLLLLDRRFTDRVFGHFGWMVGPLAGLFASYLSGTRGAWVSLPLLGAVGVWLLSQRKGSQFAWGAVVVFFAVAVLPAVLPQSPVRERILSAWHDAQRYEYYAHYPAIGPDGHLRHCVNGPHFMRQLATVIRLAPRSSHGLLRIVNDAQALRRSGWRKRCMSGEAYEIHVPRSGNPTTVVVPRSLRRAGRQRVAVLARGNASLEAVWRGVRTQIHGRAYRVFSASGRTGDLSATWLLLRPGATLRFLPLQLVYGEYTFVLTENGVGERFALWDAAWRQFMAYPIFGVGTGAFRAEARQLVREHRVPPAAWRYQHAHNDFLNQLATNGIAGLIALFSLYLVIALGGCARDRHFWAYGLMLAGAMAIFGLTETMLIHSLVISWLVIAVAVGLAVADRQEPTEVGA